MALATIAQALTQFNASSNWYGSLATAKLRLEAVEFLLVNRATRSGDQGSTIDFESLEKMAETLRAFVGTAPRSFGRSRRIAASMRPSGVQ